MKKKIVTLLLVAAMTGTMVVGCGSKADDKTSDTKTEQTDDKKDTEEKKELADDEYQYVSAADTVSADGVHVLDVREWENYSKGRVANSEWCPIFPLEDDSLVDEMTTYAKDHLNDGKDIYLICNSGKRGAEKATGVLRDAGIEPTSIYTVEGGAEALGKENGALTTDRTEENIDWKYVAGKDAVDKVGDKDVKFLDVRDDDTYKAGHLKGTLQCSLKEFDTPEAQTEMYNLAKDKMDKDEPVYILCYSGNKCAKTAISVMKDAGFDTDNLFIIENGAKDGDVSAAFVTE
ncbi:rhodanese-like domain-containing protein [Dorea amylophila]|uniref:rhodanese-like domain-containing protein n=1 Tax=Dorea amylophila TaxID=2981789 RepID=UPI0022E963E6|nr:rhodanese-like domain-containing protein [Dorea amylophila]